MAGSTARLALVALGSLALSCSDQVPTFVSWPAGDFAAALLIHETSGRVESVVGPFVVEDGTPVADENGMQQINFGAEDSIVFVGIGAEDLERLAPTVVLEDMASATAAFDGEVCEGGRVLEAGRRVRLAIPRSMQTELSFELESASFVAPSRPAPYLAGLVLELPVDDDRCLEAAPIELAPFGAEADLLPPGTIIGGTPSESESLLALFRVERVDEDRVLALAGAAIYLFERGRPYEDDGAHVFLRADLDVPGRQGTWYFSDFALLPEREPGRRRVLAIATLFSSPDGRANGVFELEVDELGLHFVRTSTTFSGFDTKLMAVGPNDELFAGGGNGWIVHAAGPDAPITAFQVPGVAEAFEISHWAVGEETLHVLGAYDGGFYVGNVFDGPSGIRREGPDYQTTTPSSMSSLRGPNGVEVYVATSRTGMFRRDPEEGWSAYPFAIPSNVKSCTQVDNECGRGSLARKAVPRGLTAAPERRSLFFGAQTCSAVFELFPDRGCTVALVFGGGAAEAEMGDYPAVAWAQGRLLVGGDKGRLLEGVERAD